RCFVVAFRKLRREDTIQALPARPAGNLIRLVEVALRELRLAIVQKRPALAHRCDPLRICCVRACVRRSTRWSYGWTLCKRGQRGDNDDAGGQAAKLKHGRLRRNPPTIIRASVRYCSTSSSMPSSEPARERTLVSCWFRLPASAS